MCEFCDPESRIGKYLNGVASLSEAINDFNEKNKELVSYLPDETKRLKMKGEPLR